MHRSEERLIRQILMPRKYFSSNPCVFVNNNTTIDCRHTRKIINFFIINSRTCWKYKDFIWYSLSRSSRIHDNDRISFLRKRLKYREVIWVNWQDRAELKINIEVWRCKCLPRLKARLGSNTIIAFLNKSWRWARPSDKPGSSRKYLPPNTKSFFVHYI